MIPRVTYLKSVAIVFALCLVRAETIADEQPVSATEDASAALNRFRNELETSWVVVGNARNGPLYIASAPRPAEQADGFCVRDVIRLARDETGAVASLSDQIEWVFDGGRQMVSQMYALIDSPPSCATLSHEDFFPIQAWNGRPTRQFLALLHALVGSDWRESPRYEVSFGNELVERCLARDRRAVVLEAAEDEGTIERKRYTISLGGCEEDGVAFVVVLRADVVQDAATVRVFASSIPRSEFDCVRRGCWDDV
jgi:hypothetical protein